MVKRYKLSDFDNQFCINDIGSNSGPSFGRLEQMLISPQTIITQ